MFNRPASISIHYDAIRHNLGIVRKTAPGSRIMAAVKADAYGHGMLSTAATLEDMTDGFMVACISEAVALREHGIGRPILVVQGHQSIHDLEISAAHDLRLAIHDAMQLQWLDAWRSTKQVKLAIKLDTGMHRLGLPVEQAAALFSRLKQHASAMPDIWLMSHLACADTPGNSHTRDQLDSFASCTADIPATRSIANSAAILAWPEAHYDWVRPGIMLYGSSPLDNVQCATFGLEATMSFSAPLIAVHRLKRGDSIGYGATWSCPEDMTVGVVACGYADGYPRHAGNGAPVFINGKTAQLVGRVSMDMVVIDLRGIDAQVGNPVELWGKHNNIDKVARSAGTISYELLCRAGSRIRNYS